MGRRPAGRVGDGRGLSVGLGHPLVGPAHERPDRGLRVPRLAFRSDQIQRRIERRHRLNPAGEPAVAALALQFPNLRRSSQQGNEVPAGRAPAAPILSGWIRYRAALARIQRAAALASYTAAG